MQVTPSFLKGLMGLTRPLPRPWDPEDATKLLTAITFAGLGGFWILFYSYWLRVNTAALLWPSRTKRPSTSAKLTVDRQLSSITSATCLWSGSRNMNARSAEASSAIIASGPRADVHPARIALHPPVCWRRKARRRGPEGWKPGV